MVFEYIGNLLTLPVGKVHLLESPKDPNLGCSLKIPLSTVFEFPFMLSPTTRSVDQVDTLSQVLRDQILS